MYEPRTLAESPNAVTVNWHFLAFPRSKKDMMCRHVHKSQHVAVLPCLATNRHRDRLVCTRAPMGLRSAIAETPIPNLALPATELLVHLHPQAAIGVHRRVRTCKSFGDLRGWSPYYIESVQIRYVLRIYQPRSGAAYGSKANAVEQSHPRYATVHECSNCPALVFVVRD
jgi:hypothetical protein